jgi:hypothetical protein
MAAMRSGAKTAKAIATWAVATGVGIGVSWFGVRPVLDTAVPERLIAFPDAGPHKTPLAQTPAGRLPESTESGTRSAGSPPVAPVSGSPQPIPRPASQPASPAASPDVTTPPPAPPSTEWTPTAARGYTRTFRMVGGRATVRAGNGSVELVSATPRPGYVMAVTPVGDSPLVVTFTNVTRTSKLEVFWVDDKPAATVTEIP